MIPKENILNAWIMCEHLSEGNMNLKDKKIRSFTELINNNYYDFFLRLNQIKFTEVIFDLVIFKINIIIFFYHLFLLYLFLLRCKSNSAAIFLCNPNQYPLFEVITIFHL